MNNDKHLILSYIKDKRIINLINNELNKQWLFMNGFIIIEYEFYSNSNFCINDYDNKITNLFKNHP